MEASLKIERFAVKDGEVRLTLSGSVRPGMLDELCRLAGAEVLTVRMEDRQIRLAVVEGSDGHVYPAADAAGNPLLEETAVSADAGPGTQGRRRGRRA